MYNRNMNITNNQPKKKWSI